MKAQQDWQQLCDLAVLEVDPAKGLDEFLLRDMPSSIIEDGYSKP